MDDDAKDILKAGMEVALRPVTSIAEDALGRMGGDWLHEVRERNRARLRDKTEEILRQRNVDVNEAISPSVILPILSDAQEESRDELVDLWARLLAAGLDPARSNGLRREFIDTANRFEPLDALVLNCFSGGSAINNPVRECSARLSRAEDAVCVSLIHLAELGCVVDSQVVQRFSPYIPTELTPYGREFLRVLYG